MNRTVAMCRLVLLTVVSLAVVQSAHAQGKVEPKKIVTVEGISEYQLPNGVRFLLFPDKSASTVTINMTVLVGSRHEGYGESGMAHLLEHMLFKGSPKFKEPDKSLARHGAGKDSNGTTWLDRTNYYETMPADDENLKFGIEFEADRLVNCYIKREDLDKEMTVVRSEFEQGENSPEYILSQRMMSAAFQWHSYGKSTIGNKSDIELVPIERLQEFYRKYYRCDNILLMVAGKFDEAKALGYISQYFGALKKPPLPVEKTYTVEPVQDGERVVMLRRVGKVPIVGAIYHTSAAAQEDNPPLEVLSMVLSTPVSGRLFKALVDTKKATSVSASNYNLHDPGIMELTAIVADKATPEEVRNILLDVVENLDKNPVTKVEVDRAVKQYLSDRELTLARSKRVGLELSDWAGAGDWRLMFIFRDRVAKVTPVDVNRVAATYFKKSNRTVGMFFPTQKPDRTTVPPTPDVAKLVKDYKGGKALDAGEAFNPTPANIEARVKRLQLKSGIKVAILPKKTRGEANVGQLVLHFGNEKSLQNMTTACDFLGDLMERGTANHSRQDIQELLDKYSSTLSVSSDLGSLSVNWRSKSDQLGNVLKLLEEILRKPIFPDKEFGELRDTSRQQYEKGLTDPQALARTSLRRKLNPYPKTDVRYVPTLAESIERLDKATRADVVKLYKEQVGGQVGELVLIGDFDVDSTLKKLEAIFAGWQSEVPYERIKRTAQKVDGSKENILTPDKENAVYVAAMAFDYADKAPDYPALLMGNYMLGGSFTSRLIDKLRQKDGLCYGVGSQLQVGTLDPYSMFLMFAICNPLNINKVDDGAMAELTALINKGVTIEELELAKKGYLQSVLTSRGEDSHLATALRNGLYLGRTFEYQADLEKKIAALTVDDVNRALSAHLNASRLTIVRAGDFNKKSPSKK